MEILAHNALEMESSPKREMPQIVILAIKFQCWQMLNIQLVVKIYFIYLVATKNQPFCDAQSIIQHFLRFHVQIHWR